MDLLVLAELLVKHCTPEQLNAILEDHTAAHVRGCCPTCGEEEEPYDKEGKHLGHMDDVSNAVWDEVHDIGCIVTLLEELRVVQASRRSNTWPTH